MKLNLINKRIEKYLSSQYLGEQSSWVRCYGLEKLNLIEGQHIGTAESNTRVYDLRVYKNDGSMVRIHNQSEWIVILEGRENESDRLEKIETAKWLLSKGVITPEEAYRDYGYNNA